MSGRKHIAIAGGGLVGAVTALALPSVVTENAEGSAVVEERVSL